MIFLLKMLYLSGFSERNRITRNLLHICPYAVVEVSEAVHARLLVIFAFNAGVCNPWVRQLERWDRHKPGESKNKLEPTSMSQQLLFSLPLVVWVSHRSWVLSHKAKYIPDLEKLKEDPGESGVLVDPAHASHQQGKPTDKQQCV